MVKERDPRGVGRKGGFKSFGNNLPQNAYKGKVEKIREGLIHNAKVKRAYYRTLKREEKAGALPSLQPLNKNAEIMNSADLDTLHPSRSHAISQPVDEEDTPDQRPGGTIKSRPRPLTKAEKLALAEQARLEAERNQKERERKIKLREKKRKDLRKMTSKGQPVMKTRLNDLLGKVKKVMKDN